MRFFIALEIPEESKAELEAVQRQIKTLIPKARLTDPQKLHLTIAFVGEQPEDLKDKLIEVINSSTTPPFSVTPAYIDGFPNIHKPHTLWIGVKGDIDKLLLTRERVKDGLKDLGLVVDERRYTPHIAIAKINNMRLNQLETELQQLMTGYFSPIYIHSIKLFESVPDEGLHKHNTLAEIPL